MIWHNRYVKFILVALFMVLYGCSAIGILLFIWPGKKKYRYLLKNTSFYSFLTLEALNIKIQLSGQGRLLLRQDNFLLVSNHLSYLDILVISSLFPGIFISSNEVKNTLLLGTLARLAGALFVERRNKTTIKQDINTIQSFLAAGFNVVLFPEGTSSNGEKVLPFKSTLLKAATTTDTDILPVCLKYEYVNGQVINKDNRDLVYYYGDMGFTRHFLRLFTIKSIEVRLEVLAPVTTKGSISRREITQTSFKAIYKAYV
ncbi:MAG: lysophospholipid acyltransferase family protein [bacterium]|nr:lysophospholipid acyltransferase family protein [bacterium]